MHVKTILGEKGFDVFSVSPDDTILTVLQMFRTKKIGFAIVGDPGDKILGTVSERDICHTMSMPGGTGRQTPIKQIMTQNIVTCSWDDNLAKVMALIIGQKTRHVLVYDGDAIKGIISIGDVVKHRLDESLREEEGYRKYIEGTGYSYFG